jgi:TRAP-type C4-dicarboxylate transport system substrate-binding protein
MKLNRLSLLTLLVAALPALAAEPAFKLRVATVAPRGSSFHQHFQKLGDQWKTAPGGGVLLDIYPARCSPASACR